MAQSVSGGGRVDAAGGASHPVGGLNAALAHRPGALVHGLAEGEGAVRPAAPWGGEQEPGVLVCAPPLAQFRHHGRRDWNVTVFAAFAVFDVQTGWVFAA